MLCELCTMDIVRGTMYRVRPKNAGLIHICFECRRAVWAGEIEEIDEPMCACGKMQKWLCDAAIVAPCKPGIP
jgi:hypothetical protein